MCGFIIPKQKKNVPTTKRKNDFIEVFLPKAIKFYSAFFFFIETNDDSVFLIQLGYQWNERQVVDKAKLNNSKKSE